MIFKSFPRQAYPEAFKYNDFMLKVSGKHEIYVAEYGNPKGIPVIRLHGGPGSKSKAKHTTSFNPFKYRIILFDQRGCGNSTPAGVLEENTTQNLVEDIEKLRKYLKLDKWNLVGGSWGSCLALAYAQKYPDSITNMILSGIFTFRKAEVKWIYDGVKIIFPDIYEKFLEAVPKEFASNPIQFYSKAILEDENFDPEIIKRFNYLEGNILSLYPSKERLNLDYVVDQEQINSAKIFLHYEKNNGFLKEGELLEPVNIDKIRNIPTAIIHGRYDMVCPMETAWELHKKWPEAEFEIIPDAGHHSEEPGTMNSVIKWTDRFAHV